MRRLVLSTFGSLGRSTLARDPLDPHYQSKGSYPLASDLFSQPIGGDKIPKDIDEDEVDKAFTQITLDYLKSPTGQAAQQLARMSSQRFNERPTHTHGSGLRRNGSTASSTMSKYTVAPLAPVHVPLQHQHSVNLSRATIEEDASETDEVYTETYMFGGRARTRVVGRTATTTTDGEIPIYFPQVDYRRPFTGPSVVPLTPSQRSQQRGIPFTMSTTQVRDSYYR